MKALEEELRLAEQENEDAKALIVESPERITLERDIAKEELSLTSQQLQLRHTNLAQLQEVANQR
jgi:hypothetical protein